MRLLLAVLAFAVLAAPAAAKPVTEEASDLGTRATFSYDTRKEGPPKDLVIRVFVDGEEIVERSFKNRDFLYPANIFLDEPSVQVQDFDGDTEPEALFDLYTGGAHCCLQSYLYDGTEAVELFTGNIGYEIIDNDGDDVAEFRTADDTFSGLFSSFAASLQPLKVLEYRDGRFRDVTSEPETRRALQAELKDFKKILRKQRRRAQRDPVHREGIRSALAGITADRCSLGDCAPGYALVDKAVDRGDVKPAFKRLLRRHLRKQGYDD